MKPTRKPRKFLLPWSTTQDNNERVTTIRLLYPLRWDPLPIFVPISSTGRLSWSSQFAVHPPAESAHILNSWFIVPGQGLPVKRTIKGRRLPDGPLRKLTPGDYQYATIDPAFRTGDMREQEWFVYPPGGTIGILTRKEHTILEHEDGTITIGPSIWQPHTGGWHGFLTRGVWEELEETRENPDAEKM